MKNFVDWRSFVIEILFVQFVLVKHRSQNICYDLWFFKRMRKPSFLTILSVQQNLKGCVARVLLSISADWAGWYAKYVIFKHTSWTEILHVVAEFHSTFLHRRTVTPILMGKNNWVCLICIEGLLGLMKLKAGFYIKIYFDNYHEATATRKKMKEIWKIKKYKK